MQDDELLQTGRFRVVRRTHELADGTRHSREVILHPGAVVILPLLSNDRIVLIRNYRFAVCETLLELPAGTLEPGEDIQHAARRELQEETGYSAESLELLHSFWMSPGILQERMHLFVATDLSDGQTHLDMGEQIEPVILTWDQALEQVREGAIHDAKTLVGLLWYDRWRRKK